MKKTIAFLIAFIAMCIGSTDVSSGYRFGQSYTLGEYIYIFRPLALEEMNRTGVPASVTLAQAILESAYGNSTLAIYANNHFGLKCKPDWKGETFSCCTGCYKKYESPFDSYEDHSNHIKSHKRYASLFKLKITDYKGWSLGLKNAGYAEDPNYAYNLIYLIELYRFSSLDSLYSPPDIISR